MYELILRDGGPDEFVIVDAEDGTRFTPSIGGEHLRDGATLTLKGRKWIARYDPDVDFEAAEEADVIRFVCTPATGKAAG